MEGEEEEVRDGEKAMIAGGVGASEIRVKLVQRWSQSEGLKHCSGETEEK